MSVVHACYGVWVHFHFGWHISLCFAEFSLEIAVSCTLVCSSECQSWHDIFHISLVYALVRNRHPFLPFSFLCKIEYFLTSLQNLLIVFPLVFLFTLQHEFTGVPWLARRSQWFVLQTGLHSELVWVPSDFIWFFAIDLGVHGVELVLFGLLMHPAVESTFGIFK